MVSAAPMTSTMPERMPSAKAFDFFMPSATSGRDTMAPSGKFCMAMPRERASAPAAVISALPVR